MKAESGPWFPPSVGQEVPASSVRGAGGADARACASAVDVALAPDIQWAFVLQGWLHDFTVMVAEREKADSTAAKARDRKYIDGAALGGARRLHQATRLVQVWHMEPAIKQGDRADPLTMVAGKLEDWIPIWNATRSMDQSAPLPLVGPWMHDAGDDEPLPHIPADQMLHATTGFKKHAGLGVDSHHPLTWEQHGLEAAAPLAAALEQAESEKCWPLLVAWDLIFLMTSQTGTETHRPAQHDRSNVGERAYAFDNAVAAGPRSFLRFRGSGKAC